MTKTKNPNGHPLAASLALHFQPCNSAYSRLQTSIAHCFALLHNNPRQSLVDNLPNDISSVHAVHTHFQETFENLGANMASNGLQETGTGLFQVQQHFCGAMAALASLSSMGSNHPVWGKGRHAPCKRETGNYNSTCFRACWCLAQPAYIRLTTLEVRFQSQILEVFLRWA